MRRKPRDRGKIALGSMLVDFQLGQRVRIIVNPAVQKGMPHRRYHGRVGTVSERRGRAYMVDITAVGGKVLRHIIARPEHIKLVEENA
jgi:large subunit ribosomal protein L21e